MKRQGMAAIVLAVCWGLFITPVLFASGGGTNNVLQLPNRGTRNTRINRPPASSQRSARRPLSNANVVTPGAPSTQIGFLAGSAMSAGGNSAYAEVAGDFNGDGKQDAASIVGNSDGVTFSLSVLLGNGDGTFASPVLTPVSFQNTDRLYAADLNGDGKSDLVFVHDTNLDIYLANGNGTFANAVNYADGLDSLTAGLLADVNGDGKVDIILASGIPAQGNPNPMVSTLLGNGDGTFQPASSVPFPAVISNGVFADLNLDGKLDVVTSMQVFLADPAGGYQSGVSLVSSNNQTVCFAINGAVAVSDVNQDGLPDIVTADCNDNTVTVYLNSGSGSFQPGTSYWAGYYPQGISVVDASGDGHLDIVSTNSNSSDITILAGNGDGTFQTPRVGYSAGGYAWQSPAMADFNGDGKADVLVSNFVADYGFAITFMQGFGDGSFRAARDYFSPPQPPGTPDSFGLGVASADFNGDGTPDVVLGTSGPTGTGITVFLGRPDGTLLAGVNYGTTGSFNFVATGDFNGDGKQDIVSSDTYAGDLDLFLGVGDGTFQSPQTFPAVSGYGSADLVSGDFNHDGKPDVAIVGYPPMVTVLLNTGSGFSTPVSYSINSLVSAITLADINGDGNPDLLLPQFSSSFVSVLLGKADGTFQAAADVNLGFNNPARIAVGDFNGDGKQDLAVTIDDSNNAMGIAIALGNGDGTFQPASLYNSTTHNLATGQPFPNGIQAVDIDRDGVLDLVYSNSVMGDIGILFGKGDGTFYAPVEFAAGGYPYGVAVADVNGDGAQDAVVSGGNFPGVTVLLNAGGNKVVVSSSANPSTAGSSITLSAAVSNTVQGVTAIPSGTVTFFDGATSLGSVAMSGGQASLAVSTLSAGSHSITAHYSGDKWFVPSTSAALTQVVNGLPSYQLAVNPNRATLQHGQSATFSLTVTPTNGYTGTVSFACGSLPSGVTCQFNPASVTPSGGPVQAQLTMSVASSSAAMATPTKAPNLLASISFSLFGFVLVGGLSTQAHRRLMLGAGCMIIMLMMLSLTGCGGGSNPSGGLNTGNPPQPTPQVIQVIATGSGGAGTQQVAITLTVQN